MDGAVTLDLPVPSSGGDAQDLSLPFVVGPENQLVLPPLERLLHPQSWMQHDDQGLLFNPLVLVGASGTGKTLLLRAIAQCWARELKSDAVGYFNVVDFGRDVQAAQSDGEVSEWRRSVGRIRLLVIDDLHRARERTTIDVALRSALDAVLGSGGLVVVASQKPPASLLHLDRGIRDRLNSGLTVQLQWPGETARRSILSNAAAQRKIELSQDTVDRLAKSLDGSAARVERAITEIDCGLTKSMGESETLTVKQIAAVVSRYLSVPQSAIFGKSRRKTIVYARSLAAHLARRLTKKSYAKIGIELGGRDHSTIMHADRSIMTQVTSDPATQQAIEDLERILLAG